jgi:hypothetical protein
MPIAGGDFKIILEIRGTDEVDDDVDAFPVCSFEDLRGPVLRFVVEARGRTEVFGAEVDFFLGAGGDEDLRGAAGFGELDTGDCRCISLNKKEGRMEELLETELAPACQRTDFPFVNSPMR